MRDFARAALAACLLAAASSASALQLSADRGGDAVLLPYYSLHGDDTTLFDVVNHADHAKAVRIVVAEGRNGRVALSFNVYLAPRDAWSGAMIADQGSPPAPPRLVTADDSCTSAPIPTEGVSLRTHAFSGSRDDGLGQEMGRLYQGQIEVIELGELTGAPAALAAARDCAALRARFAAGGAWDAAPNADVAAPKGRLSASAQLVNVPLGAAYDIPAVTFSGFSAAARHGRGDTDYQAVRIFKPTLAAGATEFDVAGGRVPVSRPQDAVSLLLMNSRFEVPFALQASIAARTRLVVAFPTRAAYVDDAAGGELPAGTPVAPPFTPSQASGAVHGESVTAQTIDRQGVLAAAQEIELVEQVNALELGEMPLATGAVEAGRLRIGLHPESHALMYSVGPLAGNARLNGLPVVAFTLIEAGNAQAQPGRVANYAITGRAVGETEGAIDF